MSEPRLRLERVSVCFGPQPVLRDISIEIPFGETVAVIGESGCGKTCLLKLIVGLLQPSEGTVHLGVDCVNRLGERELTAVRRKIGFLFQGAALFDSLSVFDNVAFGLRHLNSIGDSEIRKRVEERLADVGLEPAVGTKMPAELSGGMRKRVGLARALALNPDIILYDEPTTGLDPAMTETINDLILQTRNKRPITSLLVTHEMRTVRRVANRVIMLEPFSRLTPDESQVIFDGPASQFSECPDSRVRKFVR